MTTLTSLYIWRRVTELGYFPLESFMSSQELADECILCIDPESNDDTVPLAEAICRKYPKSRIIPFAWPKESSNGSAIGIASNYALAHVRTSHVLNVQADEVYPPQLIKAVSTLWSKMANVLGYEAFEFKVLHTEKSASGFQGGGTWKRQLGAGYTHAIKLWKNCACYRFSPDGWSIQGNQSNDGQWHENNVRMKAKIVESETWPILHLHDFFVDTVLERRRVQAEELWEDTPHYRATYEAMKNEEGEWKGLLNDPAWTRGFSPFEELMPEYVRYHLGRTSYRVQWDLLK